MMIIGLIISYLLGAVPTAYLFGKLTAGIDIREHGSGNVGATNVFRVLGKGRVTDGAENWSRRFKANSEKLRSGDIQLVADVVRNLSIRDRQKGLSTGEKRMLNRARQILAGEIAVALKLEAEEAEAVLEEALS